jgi:hypothetical protein
MISYVLGIASPAGACATDTAPPENRATFAHPLRDVRPAFFARDSGDRRRARARRLHDESFDGKPPVLEAVCLKAPDVIARRRGRGDGSQAPGGREVRGG